MTATSPTDALSYYGRPIIKEPVWEKAIPLYFFTGGLAGASDLLALGAQLSGNQRLRTSALAAATAGVGISPYFLIKDLGRPLRFLNMLRVFKVTSLMSVGTWIFSAESTATGIAAADPIISRPRVDPLSGRDVHFIHPDSSFRQRGASRVGQGTRGAMHGLALST